MSNSDAPIISVTRGQREGRGRSSEAGPTSSWLDPTRLASGVLQGARSLWWAGLGVLSVAGETGTQLFEALVEEGKSWEQHRRRQTRARAEQVQVMAEEKSDFGEVVEERVQQEVGDVLGRLGVPRRRDLDALRGRVNDLAVRIERLADLVDRTSDKE